MRSPFAAVATAALAAVALARPAAAQERPGARGEVVAPAHRAQRALAVAIADDAVLASVCDRGAARCRAADGARFVPPESARGVARGATARPVRLAGGHHVVHVEARAADGTWNLVLAAPPGGEDEARVVWSGWTGRPSGSAGERRESRITVVPEGGGSRVAVASRRDDLSLCGRGAWTSARAIDPATLELSPIGAADPLAGVTGARAPDEVRGEVVGAGAGTPARLLAPLAGSRPGFAALVDGDPASAWGDGGADMTFETATFVATPELPVRALELRLVPPPGEETAAARGVVVATPDRLVRVRVPDVRVPAAGVVVRAALPAPIAARCVAVVLEPPAGRAAPAALVAEIGARTALDEVTLEQAARGLGGADGAARAALLARAGEAGVDAAMRAYGVLDAPGQDMARRVIDAAPCSTKAPFYVAQLGDRDEAIARRAVDRVARCGDDAVGPLLAALDAAPPERVPVLADALGIAAPDRAIEVLVARIGATTDDPTRAALRNALSRAARRSRAAGAIARALEPARFGALPLVARVDLVRAAAPRLATTPGGAAAFASLSDGDFRTRYLVAPASAELARGRDAAASAWLERTIRSDSDPRLRARAVRAASRAPALLAVVAGASGDAEPRVREAAAIALGRAGEGRGAGPAARPAVGEVHVALARGVRDEWTYVREAAAWAAASWPSEPRADAALAAAAEGDAVVRVRRAAIAALGARRAVAHVGLVRARAAAAREDLDVRAEAIRALGSMCDRSSLDMLSEVARRAAAPFSEADRKLGGAAIEALAALHPPDLRARLAPLLAKDAPREARERATRALGEPGRCR